MRSLFPLLLGLILSALPTHAADPARPNIVIIFCDDLGYGDIGPFGAKGYETPHLNRMAAQGRVFRNFHVPQAVCSASRAALLTGCYPNRVGIHGALGPRSKVGLNTNETTLAEIVKGKGYATALFGKWHLGDAPEFLPLRHGFDQYFGLPYSNDMWPHHPDYVDLPPAVAKRKQGYPDLPLLEGDKVSITPVTAEHQAQLTTWYTERAVKFIEGHRQQPFFLYLAHSMPHVPLYVSDKFKGKTARGLYGDVIAEIDWSVGQVMDALARTGQETNTWLIFTSDNGPWLSYGEHSGSAGPLREGKGTAWEGGTRVPCIMRWPGKIPAGTESADMLMTIDLLPTVAGLIEAKLPERRIDGLNVWPLIEGRPGAKNPHDAYWFYYQQNELQSVVTGDGRWKMFLPHTYRTMDGRPGGKEGRPTNYTQAKVTEPELYDLEHDLGEKNDVASAHPQMMKRLQGEAARARAELGDALTKAQGKGNRPPGRLP